jgi:glycerol-3-phosphate dehydrogenase
MAQHLPRPSDALIEHLLASHGLGAEAVLACAAAPAELQPLSDVIPLTAAEVRHAVRHEWARSADDVLARRCRLAFVDRAESDRLEPVVRALVDQELDSWLPSPTSHQKNP